MTEIKSYSVEIDTTLVPGGDSHRVLTDSSQKMSSLQTVVFAEVFVLLT